MEQRALALLNRYLTPKSFRHLHSMRVYTNAQELCAVRGIEGYKRQLILSAALLHDVGYTESYKITGFHPVDGYLLIKDLFPKEVSDTVLYHSFAFDEMLYRRVDLKSYYRGSVPAESYETWRLVTMADLQSDGQGNKVTVHGRYADIAERHGLDSEVFAFMASIRPKVDALFAED